MNRICALLLACAGFASAANLTIEMTEAPGGKGAVKIALWRDATGFPKGQGFKVATVQLADGKAKCVFSDLEPGDYAVSVYVDKNGNGKLDTNMLGKPTEPYGFSNDARSAFGPPQFEEAKFTLSASGQTITIHLK